MKYLVCCFVLVQSPHLFAFQNYTDQPIDQVTLNPAQDSELRSMNTAEVFFRSIEGENDTVGVTYGLKLWPQANTKGMFGLNIKAMGPLNKDKSPTNLASFDGLANSARLDIGLSYSRQITDPDQVVTLLNEGYEKNIAENKQKIKELETQIEILKSGIIQRKARLPTDPEESIIHLNDLENQGRKVDKLVQELKSLKDAQDTLLWGQATGGLQSDHLTGKQARLYAEAVKTQNSLTFGVNFGFGEESFKYRDDMNPEEPFKATKVMHENKTLTFTLGFIPKKGLIKRNSYIGVSFKKQEFFKGNKATDICELVTGSDDLITCSQQVIGAPTEKENEVVSLEYRRIMGSVGINPKWSHADGDDKYQLPVYFIRPKDEKIPNGGVIFAWDSADKEITVSLFVGQPFKAILN